MSVVLVTGGGGFVGSNLIPELARSGRDVRQAGKRELVAGDFSALLSGVDAVVHCAGLAHRQDPAEGSFQEVNVDLTRSLARAAAEAHVRRFVYLSSAKAIGEATRPGERWTEKTACRPQSAYGQSKRRAEETVELITRSSSTSAVILRPPLVYGPGMKANMRALFSALSRGLPLPLASIDNARSFIYVGNLTSAIMAALGAEEGGTYLVKDDADVSTPELARRAAKALGRRARLWPFPPALLILGGRLLRRANTARSLVESQLVDDGKIRRELGWRTPFTMEEGLARTAQWFLAHETRT